jgi:hypothetical protein
MPIVLLHSLCWTERAKQARREHPLVGNGLLNTGAIARHRANAIMEEEFEAVFSGWSAQMLYDME